MRFDVYCDESGPDLFSSRRTADRFLVIGGLWLASSDRDAFKGSIHALRGKHRIGGESKWQKISPSRVAYYADLARWFVQMADQLRFRCIAVDRDKVDMIRYHQADDELGFYKFYYQMLHHWILDFNEYSIFCDYKRNRLRSRLHTLHECLERTNLSAAILRVQAIRSRESVLMQLADVLTGAAAARLNARLTGRSAKLQVVRALEEELGRTIGASSVGETKFNVFVISLQGGW